MPFSDDSHNHLPELRQRWNKLKLSELEIKEMVISSIKSGEVEALKDNLQKLGLQKVVDFTGNIDLRGIDLSEVSLDNACLDNFNLNGAILDHSTLLRTSFRNTLLEKSSLVNCKLQEADFSEAQLSFADFSKSDLWNAKLYNSRLWGTNFDECHLSNAKLTHTYILFARIDKAQIDNRTEFGSRFIYEEEGDYVKASEAYLKIKNVLRSRGYYKESALYYYREMYCAKKSAQGNRKVWLSFFDLLCGFGEKPLRTVFFATALIIFFAFLYTVTGFVYRGIPVNFGFANSNTGALVNSQMNLLDGFLHACYFSAVTFSTLGYGDCYALGYGEALSAIESILGIFFTSLSIVVFTRKMIRD